MPASLARLAANDQRTIPVQYASEVVNVTYSPGVITGNLAQQAAEDRSPRALCELLATVMSDWDVLERDPHDGEAEGDVPHLGTDADTLMGVPLPLVAAIFAAINEGQAPEGEARQGSFGG